MNTVFNFELNFSKSYGSYAFDDLSGKLFFDAFMMYSALPLGYNHPIFDENFMKSVCSIAPQKVSNSVFSYSEINRFVSEISATSGLSNVHLCSTGALAVESAIKSALYKHAGGRNQILSLNNGFHGVNSWGFTTDRSASFARKRLEFFPDLQWPRVDIGDLCAYLSALENVSNTAAFLFEPIQCTAGDIYVSTEVLKEARNICARHDICFIADEIQTGMGTTGDFWRSQADGLNPDVIIFGKKSQVSGVMANNAYAGIMQNPNQILSVTFDGDLIDVVRGAYVFKAIEKYSLLRNVAEKSKKLQNLVGKLLLNYRSIGGLVAFDFANGGERNKFAEIAFKNYLLVNRTGEKTVRIRLNLAIKDSEIDDLAERIIKSIKAMK